MSSMTLDQALREAVGMIENLLTDSQLDFQQPDGYTARERVSTWRNAIEATDKAKGL